MPELPEVEIMTRNVRRWVRGAVVLDVHVVDDRLGDAPHGARGLRVESVERRAKFLLMGFETGWLAWHFRMSGSFVRGRDPAGVRASLSFDNGERLGFRDPRRFGTVEHIPAGGFAQWESSRALGPEPWPDRRDGAWWRVRLGSARVPVKVAMLDQARVAGLGNIAASEILWRAGVSPSASGESVAAADWERIADAAHTFLDQTIRRDAGDEIRYVNAGGPNPFDVYGREGAPCARCGTPIERAVLRGRSTFWCAGCQWGG